MNRRASRILTVCAAVWLLVIWGHSCLPAAQSGAESGALLVVVQDLLPRMTDHVLRKCAHFAEYAVLGALTAAALRTSAHFSWPRALLPGPFAALCDETIQLFVPGRSGQIADVWLDTQGVRAADAADLPPVPETAESLKNKNPGNLCTMHRFPG